MGWCGGLTQDLSPGDLVIPDQAFVEEGTSKSYLPLGSDPATTCPDPALSEALSAHLTQEGIPHKHRSIWTTDAIYRETRDKVDHFKGQGACAVEMECSALFAAAQHRNIPTAALLVVSDSLAEKNWAPAFGKKEFKAARMAAKDRLLTFAQNLIN